MTKRANSGSAMHVLLDLDLGEESSSDSDFRIEDHDNDGGSDFSDDENSNTNQSAGGDDDDDDDDGDVDSDENGGQNDNGGDSDDDFSLFKDSLNAAGGSKSKKDADKKKGTTTASNNNINCQSNGRLSGGLSAHELLKQAKAKEALARANAQLLATAICCACLGDRSDDTNEIVECDNCGISVHEGCYGISDSASVSSTVSSCSTEPWFCEACKANVSHPVCELCPNRGGIFKETDVGKWVHLVCALYVPGVAFGEVDHLSSVTLFEMQYSKWGAKSCSLCEDVRFARTGVCIGCDAGMCKTYFHVTCAQAAGLLSEAHSEEADHADPFYAHCKIHSDKMLIKHRKRNFNGLRLKMDHRQSEQQGAAAAAAQRKTDDASTTTTSTNAQLRIERKLKKHRNKYVAMKLVKQEPWVPTQKMPRLLSTSASACRKLILKAELMGIDTAALEFQEAQMAALADVRKKWHIPPAFSVEFIGYYLDRISRLKEIKTSLQQQMELNKKLADDQQRLRDEYDELIRAQTQHSDRQTTLRLTISKLHATIASLCPTKHLPTIEQIGRPLPPKPALPPAAVPTAAAAAEPLPPVSITPALLPIIPTTPATAAAPPPPPPARPMSVPTAAALKMGVGFPLTNLPGTHEDPNRILSTQCTLSNSSKPLMHECGICGQCTDQHLLAKCDTCHLHYHLGCLNPPLSRHPKKSKLYGWQCSECVKSDDSDAAVALPVGPRKSRTKYGKDGTIVPVVDDSSPLNVTGTSTESSLLNLSGTTDDVRSQAQPAVPPLKVAKPLGRPPKNKTAAVALAKKREASSSVEHGGVADAKRKNVRKSATAVGEAYASPSPIVAPSLECPPVADKDQNLMDISPTTTNGRRATLGKTGGKSIKSAKATKKPKKEKILATAAAASSTSSPPPQTTPLKPSYYIDQNGVLNCLPAAATNNPVFPTELIVPDSPAAAATFEATHNHLPAAPVEDPLALPGDDDHAFENSVAMTQQELLLLAKHNRKRRKEKHRNKHLALAIAAGGAGGGGGGGGDGGGFADAESSGLTADDSQQRSPSKEHHKKKRKKKSNHDQENPGTVSSVAGSGLNGGIPRIKIKFKGLSFPGEPTVESHCFYVSAEMVRPANDDDDDDDDVGGGGGTNDGDTKDIVATTTPAIVHPASEPQQQQRHHVEQSQPASSSSRSTDGPHSKFSANSLGATNSVGRPKNSNTSKPSSTMNGKLTVAVHRLKGASVSPCSSSPLLPPAPTVSASSSPRLGGPIRHRRLSVFNPKKFSAAVAAAVKKNRQHINAGGEVAANMRQSASPNVPPAKLTKCDVCSGDGSAQDLVRCDECKKNYHFQCLEPPVKKTPKRRGYSWHCADCDPTDVESN